MVDSVSTAGPISTLLRAQTIAPAGPSTNQTPPKPIIDQVARAAVPQGAKPGGGAPKGDLPRGSLLDILA